MVLLNDGVQPMTAYDTVHIIAAGIEANEWLSDIAKRLNVPFALVRAVFDDVGTLACHTCNGYGRKADKPCSDCSATGIRQK